MARKVINGDMKVWDVIQQYPQTYGVFREFGCPDVHKGSFAVSAHFMKVRWAARAHRIDLDSLLRRLNEVIAEDNRSVSSALH
ncbi:MAG: DUF1858 domain-containing protein [Syntrophotaleaceae bacterium]